MLNTNKDFMHAHIYAHTHTDRTDHIIKLIGAGNVDLARAGLQDPLESNQNLLG